MTRPRPTHDRPDPRSRQGFTLVELLMVIVILALLIALLLPAINSAIRTSRKAAVGAEINSLSQALAAFKNQYGDYPPSRVYLAENGDFGSAAATQIAAGDISYAQLSQRTVSILRKFFPRVVVNTGSSGALFPANSTVWYDFNGNGTMDAPYILQGHECLVFFLGGIPLNNGSTFSMTGFGKDPTNPFTNNGGVVNSSDNRTTPFYEFAPNRLALDASRPTGWNSPGYIDNTGNTQGSGAINFYAYFSAYGKGGYDPNDVNFVAETDNLGSVPTLIFKVAYPITPPAMNLVSNTASSAPPNPYTSSSSVPMKGNVSTAPTFLNPQSFQLISSGNDGLYGLGGIYLPDSTSSVLPKDPTPGVYGTTDADIRTRERDNVTNFHNGSLE